jgi:hypothetical protein
MIRLGNSLVLAALVVLAVSCALVALVAAVAVVDAVAVADADAAAVAAVVAVVAAVKFQVIKKSPCGAAGTFLYCIRHKRQIVVHRIKVKCCAKGST